MLNIPDTGSGIVKIIGIDPGTMFPGVCTISYDTEYKEIIYISSICLNLDRITKNSEYVDYQPYRFLKLIKLKEYLLDIFKVDKPVLVAAEHPYMNPRMPGAVIPLAQCFMTIQMAVFDYNPLLDTTFIDPSTIKNSVGVKGNSKDKNSMSIAISKIPEIVDNLNTDIEKMNNNAVDAIAIAYCALKRELHVKEY